MHVRDTLEAGAGLCKENVVRTIIQEGPARTCRVIALGMQFSEPRNSPLKRRAGLDLGREAVIPNAASFTPKMSLGREIELALLAAIAERPNIEIFENHLAIDLIASQKNRPSRRASLPGRLRPHNTTGRLQDLCRPSRASHRRLRQSLSLHDQPRHSPRATA